MPGAAGRRVRLFQPLHHPSPSSESKYDTDRAQRAITSWGRGLHFSRDYPGMLPGERHTVLGTSKNSDFVIPVKAEIQYFQ